METKKKQLCSIVFVNYRNLNENAFLINFILY